MRLTILTLLLLMGIIKAQTDACQSIFQDLPSVLLGYTLALQPNPNDVNTECVQKTMKCANRVEMILDSIFGVLTTSNYMEPLTYSNQLMVDISDAFVACKYSTLVRQTKLKFTTLGGLFSVVFTIVYSGITKDRLHWAAQDLLDTESCFQYGYDVGVLVSEILSYQVDNVYFNQLQKFAFTIPDSVSLV